MGTKHVGWVKVNLDYEILCRLMVGLTAETGRRYEIREQCQEVNINDIEEELRQMATGVEIELQMSHTPLQKAEEYIK